MENDDLASSGLSAAPEGDSARQSNTVPFAPIDPSEWRSVAPEATAEAVCVSRTPAGDIQVLDWVCLLSRTFRKTFYSYSKTIRLELYHGQVIDLDPVQTHHLINYLSKTVDSNQSLYSRRSPEPFLKEPEIAALIDHVERSAPDQAETSGEAKE